MIKPLLNMCLSDTNPAFNDHESLTAIEMIAKFYGKLNELIEEYNSFSESTTKYIESFTNGTNENMDEFKIAMMQKFQDFISIVELQIKSLDGKLTKYEKSLTGEIIETATSLLNELINGGKITLEPQTTYNATYETLDISMSVAFIE